ncbi:MAG: protein phosphatase 2C domain-containing protein [Streptosporangiaceae bacterium]|nr:protein phosphatase 2C domain-containing protein [Streptosporangiaceae bacterium]
MINIPPVRDHGEVDLGTAAGVSDKGLRHLRNEDAMGLASGQAPDGPVVVAVVCDGVSSSPRPDEASLAATEAAVPLLLAAAQAGEDLTAASLTAVVAARESVAGLPDAAGDTSATTFISAVAGVGEVTLCWLGDSRAYWLADPAPQSRQLTHDDSVAGGMVAAGLAAEEAMDSPYAHVLTRWLGGEAADLAGDPDRAPHVEQFSPSGVGVLLVCSDGLWNYLPEPADLAGLALPKALTDPLGAAADMVSFAVDAGGADNITAVIIPYHTPAPS